MSVHSPGKEKRVQNATRNTSGSKCEREVLEGKKTRTFAIHQSVNAFFFRDHQLGSRLEEQRVENKHRERGDQQRGLHGTGETCPRHGHSVGECLLRGPSSSASRESRGAVSGPVTSVTSFP